MAKRIKFTVTESPKTGYKIPGLVKGATIELTTQLTGKKVKLRLLNSDSEPLDHWLSPLVLDFAPWRGSASGHRGYGRRMYHIFLKVSFASGWFLQRSLVFGVKDMGLNPSRLARADETRVTTFNEGRSHQGVWHANEN